MSRAVVLNQLYQTTRCALLVHEKNSVLGVLWHLLSPLGLTLVLFVVFSNVGGFADIPDYGLYILTGIIQFQFFANATTRAANAMLGSRGLILNSKIPLEIVVLKSVLVEALTYVVEVVLVVLAVGFFSANGLQATVMYFLPVLVGLFALTLGVSLALSALVVFLSDLTYIWSLFTRMLFFLTPIFYKVEQVDHPIASKVIAWNPLGGLTIAGRDALLYGTVPQGLWILVGLSFLVFLLGWFVFTRLRPAVPDYV